MKTTTYKTALTLILWHWLTNPAYAAAGVREDNSSIFVWIFLALCALIIVGQLIPAFLVLTGFAKGLKKEKPKEAAAEVAENGEP